LVSNVETLKFVSKVIKNMPEGWLKKTTHRLDIYNEAQAKTEFLEGIKRLEAKTKIDVSTLKKLPTAYDYIRLGHPLSCLLEWTLAEMNNVKPENVISFSSSSMPIHAVLRKNLLNNKKTRIVYQNSLPNFFKEETLKKVYGYNFNLVKINSIDQLNSFDGTTVFIKEDLNLNNAIQSEVDIFVNILPSIGSVVFVNNEENNKSYISEIQHVRRRESISMTPSNSLLVLESIAKKSTLSPKVKSETLKKSVLKTINEITGANTSALLGSCGLSVQYAITMGLIDEALESYPGKDIKIIVPPNCYGGTNDQARRVAACIENVEVMDLPVDSGSDMESSVERVLSKVADLDAVPFIIAEIPTNPRVEVPELIKLRDALSKKRITKSGEPAVSPVFILDQTFCPNFKFLGDGEILSSVKTISYVSGSKFPSGGLCTAGYCVANKKAEYLMSRVEKHLKISDNEATAEQIEILEQQMPSMNQRILDAYKNTRKFVDFIQKTLPEAKINFVSEELAREGFTPSVFSLDLPTKGSDAKEKEVFKREMNHKLIGLMIDQVPEESQHCVSYGQLKGCYWTVPATSTQGTTKEGDKDYIVRVSMSPQVDLEKHMSVFKNFVESFF